MEDTLSPHDRQQLELYADGELPAAEQAAFESRLAAEPALQAALRQHRTLVAGIRAAGRAELRQRLTRLRDERRATTAAAAPPMSVMRWRWSQLAAAAALVLATGLGGWLVLRGPDRYAAVEQYGIADPGLPVLMSGSPSERPRLNQAMNAYKLGDYPTALAFWNQLPTDQIGPDTLHYYRGIFLLRLRRPAEAAAELALVRTQRQSALRARADYYHALALWAAGRVNDARQAFAGLADHRAHPFAGAAREALPHVK